MGMVLVLLSDLTVGGFRVGISRCAHWRSWCAARRGGKRWMDTGVTSHVLVNKSVNFGKIEVS